MSSTRSILTGSPPELGQAFKDVFDVPDKFPFLFVLRTFFPIFRFIVSHPENHMRFALSITGPMSA